MNNKIEMIKNLVGTVSNEEIKYQLNQLHEEYKVVGIKVLMNYVGKVSDREMIYQLNNLKGAK